MDTLYILSKILFENITTLLPVALTFLLITAVGVVIFLEFYKTSSIGLLISGGGLLGLFFLMALLAVLSYLFRGPRGIEIIWGVFAAIGLLFYKRNTKYFRNTKILFDKYSLFSFFLFILLSVFMVFQVGTNIYGGDVIAYWGFATSFANGNYPLVAPWQPDILANHHQATYLLEGAVHSITNADMQVVHSLYSYFVIVMGTLLVWSFSSIISSRKVLSILMGLVLFFSVGGFFLHFPVFIEDYLNPETVNIKDRLPLFLDAKNRLGGASNLPDLIYINHRAASFSGVILLMILIIKKIRKKYDFFKPTLIALLSVPIISSDESYLPSIGLIVAIWSIYRITNSRNRYREFKSFLLAGLVFAVLFAITGSAIRDSALTPPKELPRFTLLTDENMIKIRFNEFKGVVLKQSADSQIISYLPSVYFFGLLAISLVILSPNPLSLLFLIGAIGAIIANFAIEHTYYPGNNGRFLHIVYVMFSVSVVNSSLSLLNSKKVRYKIFSGLVLGIYALGIAYAFAFLIPYAKHDDYLNLRVKRPQYDVLVWSEANLPQKRLTFIDGYLRDLPFSYLSLFGMQNYGLIVPVSPTDYKVHTSDYGPEAIDVINTLNPSATRKIGIEYVFVTHEELIKLPVIRQKQLSLADLFPVVYQDELGTMYKVTEEYLSSSENLDSSLEHLVSIIPKNSVVYIDWAPRLDHNMRSVMTLIFKEHKELVMKLTHGTFNYIETKIITREPEEGDKYDYVIANNTLDPLEVCNCSSYEKIWETFGASAYKVTDDEN